MTVGMQPSRAASAASSPRIAGACMTVCSSNTARGSIGTTIVEQPNLLSPRASVRAEHLPAHLRHRVGVAAHGRAGRRRVPAPSSSGPWLPAERTFSSLLPERRSAPSVSAQYDFGVEHEFGSPTRTRRIGVRRFWQNTADQIATLFGLDAASGVGPLLRGRAGDVDFEGWAVGRRPVTSRRASRAASTTPPAKRPGTTSMTGARPAAPGAVGIAPRQRTRSRRLHHAGCDDSRNGHPRHAWPIASAPRSSAPIAPTAARSPAGASTSRSARQLPYQPLRGGKLDVLFAVRTLLRDAPNAGGFFDELLTSSPADSPDGRRAGALLSQIVGHAPAVGAFAGACRLSCN